MIWTLAVRNVMRNRRRLTPRRGGRESQDRITAGPGFDRARRFD